MDVPGAALPDHRGDPLVVALDLEEREEAHVGGHEQDRGLGALAQARHRVGVRIHGRGLRMTEQRRAVYDALMVQRDHPTAVEVFMRVKTKMPSISLATVYNCLETLTDCGIIKAVNHDREPSRYCPNLAEHAHLFCAGCGGAQHNPFRADRRPQDLGTLP